MFMLCRSLFVNLSFVFWPMCNLSLFDLRIQINLGIFHVRLEWFPVHVVQKWLFTLSVVLI